MKKIIGLAVIVAALVLGGYYAMGIGTERTIERDLEAINQSNGLSVNVVSYKRGWFSSQAELDWRLHIPEHVTKSVNGQSQVEPAQDFEMKMPLIIYHGPIMFVNKGVKFGQSYAHSDIVMPPKYEQQFNDFFTKDSTKPKIVFNLFVNYFSNGTVEISLPSFKLIAKKGGEFSWKGMDSSMSIGSDSSKLKGYFEIDGMDFTQNDSKASIGKIVTDYNLHKSNYGLYLGDANFSLPSVLILQKDVKLFELTSLDIASTYDIQSDLFSTGFKSSLSKIVVNGQSFGPGNLEMSLKNLDADAVGRINEQAQRAQHGTDIEKQKALFAILPEIPKLLSKGAEFDISQFSMVMPSGNIEGNLSISLPKGDSANPFELLQKMKGHSKLKVPADVVKIALTEMNKQKASTGQQAPTTPENVNPSADVTPAADAQQPVANAQTAPQAQLSVDQQLTTMTQSGLLVKQGEYYVIELSLDQGKLQVNGKPFNPDMMKY